jgi:hypothetical protein
VTSGDEFLVLAICCPPTLRRRTAPPNFRRLDLSIDSDTPFIAIRSGSFVAHVDSAEKNYRRTRRREKTALPIEGVFAAVISMVARHGLEP